MFIAHNAAGRSGPVDQAGHRIATTSAFRKASNAILANYRPPISESAAKSSLGSSPGVGAGLGSGTQAGSVSHFPLKRAMNSPTIRRGSSRFLKRCGLVRCILRKYGQQTDEQDKAMQTVLEQAEAVTEEWVV